MRIVDNAEAIEWLSSRGITDPKGKMLGAGFPRKATYYLPGDSGRKTAIANALVYRLSRFDESILWINEWGIFPSGEN
jgi:hypothetical protein